MSYCVHFGGYTKTATVRQFRDRATKWEEPIMVTRRGNLVGFFLPAVDANPTLSAAPALDQ